MDIQFRKALPDDREDMIPLIYSSGPDAFDYAFSHRSPIDAHEFLRRTFLVIGNEFAFTHHIVGVHEGKVVATGVGYSNDVGTGHMISMLKQIPKHYGIFKGLGVIYRGLHIEKIVPPPNAPMHYIAHIGVTPALRGHGIGEQLMQQLIQEGQDLGRPRVTLDVSCENPRAQVLYERLGFEVTSETPSTYCNATAHIPSHRRMELRFPQS